jgi:hypothetical protein
MMMIMMIITIIIIIDLIFKIFVTCYLTSCGVFVEEPRELHDKGPQTAN